MLVLLCGALWITFLPPLPVCQLLRLLVKHNDWFDVRIILFDTQVKAKYELFDVGRWFYNRYPVSLILHYVDPSSLSNPDSSTLKLCDVL